MKLHHLIFATTAIFTILFYNEYLGLNLAIFGILLSILVLNRTKEKNRDKTFLFLFVTSILSSVAFGWYGDSVSFLAVISSLMLLRFKSKNNNFKMLFAVPSYFINLFGFIYNVFQFQKWYPKSKSTNFSKKLFAFVLIPMIFVAVFFGIYSAGSNHFSEIFSNYEWNLNFFNLIGISFLGFFLSFVFWNLLIPRSWYKNNQTLRNEFAEDQKILQPTYNFLEIDYERTSGVISLICLNVLLLIFISIYTYEQFFEVSKTGSQLSAETHNGVNAVILSIIMAILVILFYFKAGFNFDKNARYLKLFAKIWIVLNVVLIFSTLAKNTEYIINLGFTYKRSGVYGFLFISILGLIFTFLKIKNQRTNAWLFNQMFWCFFGTILVCSYVNWGGFITSENRRRKNFDVNYHQHKVHFNHKQLLDYADQHKDEDLRYEVEETVKYRQSDRFLSKSVYYETF